MMVPQHAGHVGAEFFHPAPTKHPCPCGFELVVDHCDLREEAFPAGAEHKWAAARVVLGWLTLEVALGLSSGREASMRPAS